MDAQNINLLVSDELLEKIDDFRFANRMPSRTEAIRELISRGLEKKTSPTPLKKS